ncbi:hypothetical protein [Robiginitalea aurantiaca]|uniref:Uncharacterized protein n=1 Tax=Robiginitalea aurantiaca TaxID=3056915 RepID=A0ABT7WBM5_9FLAO|nr:hypothetical protein [Robiginitalea aurantiaca]MDM9630234.1 hypothetical protein [Robiginitalea aurantiaca]
MKYLFISRPGDPESFKEYFKKFELLSNDSLLAQYNREVQIGIVGVHAQALKLLALRKIFLKRFGKSPVLLKDDMISLTGKHNVFPDP